MNDRDQPTPPYGAPDPSDVEAALSLVAERFGIGQAAFEGLSVVRISRKYLSIVAADHKLPRRPPAESVGVPFLRTNLRFPKPTTAAVLLLGRHATRNVISLTRDQAEAYVRRTGFSVPADQAVHCTGKGYVIVRHRDLLLGLGFYDGERTPGVLRSLYPRAWALPLP